MSDRMRALAKRASARAALWAGIAALVFALVSFGVGRSGSAVVLLVVGGVLLAVAATRLSRLAAEARAAQAPRDADPSAGR